MKLIKSLSGETIYFQFNSTTLLEITPEGVVVTDEVANNAVARFNVSSEPAEVVETPTELPVEDVLASVSTEAQVEPVPPADVPVDTTPVLEPIETPTEPEVSPSETAPDLTSIT